MWFGTNDGLNKYDGYTFTTYKNIPDDSTSLSNNKITSIVEDLDGNLWVGTYVGGVNRFDRDLKQFLRYEHYDSVPGSLSSNQVEDLLCDKEGRLWVGTNNGLDQLSSDLNTFLHYNISTGHLKSNIVRALAEDRKENIWVGTQNSLSKINFKTNRTSHYFPDKDNPNSLIWNQINTLYCSKIGDLWVGGRDDYLIKYNEKKNQFIRYRLTNSDGQFLWRSGEIKSIFEDRNGDLWIATRKNGLKKFNVKEDLFSQYLNNPLVSSSLSYNTLYSVYIDKSNLLWVGTFGTGLNKHSLNSKNIKLFRSDPFNTNSLSNSSLREIYEDDSGVLWIGSYSGLNSYNKETNKFTRHEGGSENIYSICPDNNDTNFLRIGTEGQGLLRFNKFTGLFELMESKRFNNISILSIKDDQKGNLWLGTDQGLLQFVVATQEFKLFSYFKLDNESISKGMVTFVYIDKSGVLWAGTEFGLNEFSFETTKFKMYLHNSNDPNSLSNNYIKSIFEDSNGALWIGTNGGGLNKLNSNTESFVQYDESEGLPSSVIYGILEDDMGDLWLSSKNGLTRFNPKTMAIKNFTVKDGLQSNEFNTNSFFKSKSGEMFFGGIEGLNSFYPNEIKILPYNPPVVITSFKKFDKEVNFEYDLSELKIIKLNSKEDFVSFEFSSLNYNNPEKNKYRYKLEGFDKKWVEAGPRRYASYTNLDGGNYTFKVKGTNSDGVWSTHEASIQLYVQAPFWKMVWFYLLIGLIVSTSIYIGFRIRLKQVKLEARKEYFKNQNEEKEYMIKEIHHRVKNNFQIVNSLLRFQSREIEDEEVLAMFEESQNRILSMAKLHEQLYNSKDLKRIDIKTHLVTLIEGLIHEYKVGIDITLDIQVENVDVGIKTLVPLGLMINELITNSLKYAFNNRKNGAIKVWIRHIDSEKYEMLIGDDGVGFNKEKKSNGLGSELVQIFTEQLDGTIEKMDVSGTQFRIEFENIDKT